MLRYRNKLYENVLFVLSFGLLLFTLYEFVVTKPFKQQDGAEFLLDKTLLEHAPLLNFIINIAVSLSFILFIGYKRKSNLWKTLFGFIKMIIKREKKKKEKLILKYSDGKDLLFYFSVFIVVFL